MKSISHREVPLRVSPSRRECDPLRAICRACEPLRLAATSSTVDAFLRERGLVKLRPFWCGSLRELCSTFVRYENSKRRLNWITKSTALRSTNDRDNGFVVALDRWIRRHTADRSQRLDGEAGFDESWRRRQDGRGEAYERQRTWLRVSLRMTGRLLPRRASRAPLRRSVLPPTNELGVYHCRLWGRRGVK